MLKNILITSGGTSEPIDRIRSITNTSTGTLGSLIAKAFSAADIFSWFVSSSCISMVSFYHTDLLFPVRDGKIIMVLSGRAGTGEADD